MVAADGAGLGWFPTKGSYPSLSPVDGGFPVISSGGWRQVAHSAFWPTIPHTSPTHTRPHTPEHQQFFR